MPIRRMSLLWCFAVWRQIAFARDLHIDVDWCSGIFPFNLVRCKQSPIVLRAASKDPAWQRDWSAPF